MSVTMLSESALDEPQEVLTNSAASGVPAQRANAPVSVVAERFLRAIVAAVPLETIEEIHLFSPLRQGVTETGIAVVAARVATSAIVDTTAMVIETVRGSEPELALANAAQSDSPYADASALTDAALTDSALTDSVHAGTDVVVTSVERHTVYSARYRLVIKGPDRGKWETDIVAEADAPLVTVETVVRGVQRRAGEDSAIARMSAAQVAYALRNETAGVAGPT